MLWHITRPGGRANLGRARALVNGIQRNIMPAIDETLEPKQAPDAAAGEAAPTLPKPVQEHLGRKLRAAYYETGDRPAYVGDPAIPPELDTHVRKLEQRERIHVKG